MLVLFARKSRLRTFDPFRAKKEKKTKRKGKKRCWFGFRFYDRFVKFVGYIYKYFNMQYWQPSCLHESLKHLYIVWINFIFFYLETKVIFDTACICYRITLLKPFFHNGISKWYYLCYYQDTCKTFSKIYIKSSILITRA